MTLISINAYLQNQSMSLYLKTCNQKLPCKYKEMKRLVIKSYKIYFKNEAFCDKPHRLIKYMSFT